ncbi:mRNA decapping complex subunit 2 [Paramyrothecium foliicola]|nr:mRNA decapping complex subunit 2 [Paramyrothecium foliicola]
MAGTQMQLEDWLDDLCVRFIINLPQEDLSSVARICFQVEEAQWFYEDFIRPLDASLPSMTLRTFCLRIFQHCPLLASFSVENHTKAFEEFLEYKTRVPVRGAIMLNHAMDSAVLVRAWKKGASWSFPRGKINKDEDDLDCAIREVWEETGLDLRAAGLVPTEAKPKYIEIPIKQQQLRLYIFRDVPMDTKFQPQTRKEISKIQWYKLSELPAFRKKGAQGTNDAAAAAQANKFYMVAPFLVPLKKWVHAQKKIDERKAASERSLHPQYHNAIEEAITDDDSAWQQQELAAPYEVPAIETLDGATQELQRLLKMQPPTQGLQPAVPQPQNDKASALLSMLQSKNADLGPASHGAAAHTPHTPLDHTVTEAPQPQNPHHYHGNHHGTQLNSHQPPPPFALNQGQGTQWNYPPAYNQGVPHLPQGFQNEAEKFYGNNRAALVHPQPLPPQVQRSILTQKVLQESSKATFAGGLPQNPTQHVQPSHQQQPPPQMLPQGYQQQPGGRPVPLNGQSMALLSAFKRDAPGAPTAQPQEPHPMPEAAHFGQGHQIPFGHQAPAQGHVGVPFQQQKSPTELAGSGVAPPTEQHRSALLSMFKKETPDAGSRRTPAESNPAGQLEKESLPHFPAHTYNSGVALSSSQGHVDVANMAMSQLSLHPRHAPSNTHPPAGARLSMSPRASNVAQSIMPTQQPQPTRILQRGQDPRSYGVPEQPSVPYGGHSPSVRPAEAGASDQKRQLLSLFGKQPGSPSAVALEAAQGDHIGGPEVPRSRVASMASTSAASSRLGRQTPISPADQSFLLDYLQSVTNNATR